MELASVGASRKADAGVQSECEKLVCERQKQGMQDRAGEGFRPARSSGTWESQRGRGRKRQAEPRTRCTCDHVSGQPVGSAGSKMVPFH